MTSVTNGAHRTQKHVSHIIALFSQLCAFHLERPFMYQLLECKFSKSAFSAKHLAQTTSDIAESLRRLQTSFSVTYWLF